MNNMNDLWPYIYQVDKEQEILDSYRVAFDRSHLISERVVGAAWFAGAFALAISPWCRRLAEVKPEEAQ